MFEELTQKQIEILLFIKSEIERKGYPPSVREICKGVKLKSTSTVHGHLKKLENKGFIRKDATKPRAIEIIDKNNDYLLKTKKTVDVPIIGRVTAGSPILAVENIEDSFPVPYEMIKDYEAFMLKVEGDSMIDAGILNGDYVLVKKQEIANNGEIVIALLDGEATIKRFYKNENKIKLQPENKFMDPIYTKNITIAGIVTGVYRKL